MYLEGGIIITKTLKEKRKKLRKQKFKTLYERIPFLKDMTFRERQWWIRYYKLKTTWEKHNLPGEFPDEKYLPLQPPYPWDEPNYLDGYLGVNSEINCKLRKVEYLFLDKDIDWIHTKLEDIEFPDVIECNFSDLEGCGDCRFRFKCELKG